MGAALAVALVAGSAAGAGVTALAGVDGGGTVLPRAAAPARPAGSLAEVAARVLPSVVSVRVGRGTGSGFVLDAEGHVLTNAHVVSGATDVRVVDSTGRTRDAELVGVDASTDLAVLRTSGGLPPVTLGRSTGLAVGDPVLAVGS
ncbi:MAG TPA: trypsin-like peptidase domain-containing protein, partial [Mycobacteriales bacterium]|nr:trypsin-like peptidase domain-containing protein [Mycobacteriales bacterium]